MFVNSFLLLLAISNMVFPLSYYLSYPKLWKEFLKKDLKYYLVCLPPFLLYLITFLIWDGIDYFQNRYQDTNLHIFTYIIIQDCLMYGVHKYIFHTYLKHLHKIHHSRRYGVNIIFLDLFYIHPLDSFLEHLLPSSIWIIIPNCLTPKTSYVLITVEIFANILAHSSLFPQTHSYHHLGQEESFSTGMLLDIKIIYDKKEQLGIPENSLLVQGSTAFVYKVLEDNTVEKVEVKIGKRNFGKVSIIDGLYLGDKIVAEGISKVRDKIKIKILN